MQRILLALTLFLLTSCIAPDGSTLTVTIFDETGQAQFRVLEVSGAEEWHRGFFDFCLIMTFADTGYADAPWCLELTAEAYKNGFYSDPQFLQHWDWTAVIK